MTHTITIHGDTGHMAVNVKTHGMRFAEVEGATDTQQEAAFEIAAESFWSQADSEAIACGFGGCHAEGRMSGWAVPHYGRDRADGLPIAHVVPYYPDVNDAKDCRRFLKWEKRIDRLLSEVPAEYKYQLEAMVNAEHAEREDSERIMRQFCEAM